MFGYFDVKLEIGAPGSDVGRGGGGRAGGGGRDDNDRGPGTNPGRPGGESGMRGSSVGSIGGTNPGRPGGESGMRGSSVGSIGGTNPGRPGGESGLRGLTEQASSLQGQINDRRERLSSLTENLRGVETTLGEKQGQLTSLQSSISDARSQFNTNQERMQDLDAQLATAEFEVNNARNRALASPNSFRDRRAAEEQIGGNPSLSAGAVTDGLDPSMGVYDAVVGDGELTAAEKEREALARDLAGTPPGEIARTRSIGAKMTQEAFDSRAKMPFGLIGTGLAALRNYGIAGEIQSDLEALEDSRSMPDGTFDATRAEIFSGLNSDSLNATSGGFFGDGLAGQRAIMGNASSAPSSNSADVNRGGGGGNDGPSGGGNDGPTIPPAPTVPAPTQPSESEETETGPYGGSLGDYSSYARRFFSRV